MKLLKRKGFTLIELVIGLALMSIVFVVITAFFLNNNNTINRTHIKSELQSEGEYIMSFISKSFMEGKAIEKIEVDASKHFKLIEISGYKENFKRGFYLNEKTLIYKEVEGEETKERVIGENIEEIKFFDNGNGNLLEIELVLSKKDVMYKLEDKLFFRNSE